MALALYSRISSLNLAATAEEVTIDVSDTGPGINADDLPHVFERFFRAGQSPQSMDKGAGLGLAIAQRILQLHDGAITVNSTHGAGTSFSFQLATAAS